MSIFSFLFLFPHRLRPRWFARAAFVTAREKLFADHFVAPSGGRHGVNGAQRNLKCFTSATSCLFVNSDPSGWELAARGGGGSILKTANA